MTAAAKPPKTKMEKPRVVMSNSHEPRWDAISCFLVGQDRGEMAGGKEANALLLYAKSYLFFHKLALFRKGETARLYLNEPDESDFMFHRALLRRLIGDGSDLVKQVKRQGMARNAEGLSLADIEATVEELQQTERQWYGKITGKRRREILQDVFDGAQP